MTIDHIYQYGHFTTRIANDTEILIDGITGDPTVVMWIGHVHLRGTMSTLTERLRTAVKLLERADEHPELWDLLLARRARPGEPVRRTWMHPFRDPHGPVPPTAPAPKKTADMTTRIHRAHGATISTREARR